MTEINKLIEEEAEKHIERNVVFGSAPIEIHEGFRKKAFIEGASFILHHYRWRKVEEELPEYSGNPFLVRGYFDIEGHRSFERRCFTAYQDMDFYEMFKEVIFDAPAYFVVTEWKPIE